MNEELTWVSRACFCTLILAGCGPVAEPGSVLALSSYTVGDRRTVRVVENVSGCVVDGVCVLTLEFSDTTVQAVYGSGERPTDACMTNVEVSNAAFALEPQNMTDVTLRSCEDGALILSVVH